MTETISIRLTRTQMSQIWPGLQYLVQADKAYRENKSGYRAYPFSLYPPASSFNRGTYHPEMMEQISDLRNEFLPRSTTGGRIHLNTIQIRASIFAVRVNLQRMRWLKREAQKRKTGQQLAPHVDENSLALAKRRSRRTVLSLERDMKRANRLLRSLVTRDEYEALMTMWKEHLRWMRLHLAYHQPWPGILRSKNRYQCNLDELVVLAARGVRDAGFEPPDEAELRRLMRLYAQSARRGLEGNWTVPFILANKNNFNTKWVLSQFVRRRSKLEQLQ